MSSSNQRSLLERWKAMRSCAVLSVLVVGLACASGCLDVLGYRDHTVGDPFGLGGTGGTSNGGDGGSTTSGCEPGAIVSCYTGPADTENKGNCKAGTQTCGEDGMPAGTCTGQVMPGVETCATTEDDDCDGSDCGIWSEIFSPDFSVRIDGFASDADSNVVVGGALVGKVKLGDITLEATGVAGSFFVAKLDKSGGVLWAKAFGDAATTTLEGVLAVDHQGNIVLAGYFDGSLSFGGDLLAAEYMDLFVAKLSPDGDHLWSNAYGAAEQQKVVDVATDGDGNVVLLGQFDGTFSIGPQELTHAGKGDVFVAKLAGSGAVLWAQRFGDGQVQIATAVTVDPSGNPVAVGLNEGTINFGNKDLTDASPSMGDVFVAKLGAEAGAESWSVQFSVDDGSYVFPSSIAVDPSFGVILGGTFNGTFSLGGAALTAAAGNDVFLGKLDNGGSHVWSRRFGGAGYEDMNFGAVAVDAKGAIHLAVQSDGVVDFGGVPLTSAGNKDLFVASFDGAGEHMWSRRFGNKEFQGDARVTTVGSDSFEVACILRGKLTSSTIDFGNGPLTPASAVGLAVTKLAR